MIATCPHCGHRFDPAQPVLFPIRPVATKARRSDPPTSHAAATYPRNDSQRWRILYQHFCSERGLTDEELSRRIPGIRLNSLTTRRSELTMAGWLYDSGERRQASGGIDQIVWKMSPAGAIAWKEGRGLVQQRVH